MVLYHFKKIPFVYTNGHHNYKTGINVETKYLKLIKRHKKKMFKKIYNGILLI